MTTSATTPRPRRSPRRLNHAHPALQSIPVDSNPPAPDSFTWRLWLQSADLAQAALQTKYIQGIARGTLDPNAYGQYTVQDAVYSYHGERDYQVAEKRAREAGEEEIAAFCKVHHESYKTYWQTTFASWSITRPDALTPGPAMKAYIEAEEYVATKAPPIYVVIAMLPCDELWAWLAEQLAPYAVPANLYRFWITEKTGFTGAYHLDNFVDQWLAGQPGEADPQKALQVFRASMTNEVNAFRAACGEELLPMPELPSF